MPTFGGRLLAGNIPFTVMYLRERQPIGGKSSDWENKEKTDKYY